MISSEFPGAEIDGSSQGAIEILKASHAKIIERANQAAVLSKAAYAAITSGDSTDQSAPIAKPEPTFFQSLFGLSPRSASDESGTDSPSTDAPSIDSLPPSSDGMPIGVIEVESNKDQPSVTEATADASVQEAAFQAFDNFS